MSEFKGYYELPDAAGYRRCLLVKARLWGAVHYPDPDPKWPWHVTCLSLCPHLSRAAFILARPRMGAKRVHRVFFFSSFFFWWVTQPNKNRRRGEGENTMACNPVPPSSASWKHSDITSHALTVKSVSRSPNGGQPLHATLCFNIKGHAESAFKLPGKYNRGWSRGGTCICVQDEEGGWVCHGKMEALWRKFEQAGFWGCTFTHMYHLSRFPSINTPLVLWTASHPLATTLELVRTESGQVSLFHQPGNKQRLRLSPVLSSV